MAFHSGRRIKQEFLKGRAVQPDSVFLASCGLEGDRAESALRVRAAIANLAGVDPVYIHAGDTFDKDLAHFDFWGSLDSIAVVLELEKLLGVQIPESQAQRIADPESIRRYTVAEFVRSVIEALDA